MTEREEQFFRDGFQMGVLAEQAKHTVASHVKSTGADGERPKLHLVPVDAPSAQLIEFPTNEKTAS